MGKWSKLKDRYPKAPVDGDYQAKIDVVLNTPIMGKLAARQLKDDDLETLYLGARERKDEVESLLSVVKLEIEAYEQEFANRFVARGQTTVTFDDGVRLYLRDEPNFIIDENKFYDWRESDPANEAEFPAKVNTQTLKSRLKSRLEENQPLPPGTGVGWIDTKIGCQGRGRGDAE